MIWVVLLSLGVVLIFDVISNKVISDQVRDMQDQIDEIRSALLGEREYRELRELRESKE